MNLGWARDRSRPSPRFVAIVDATVMRAELTCSSLPASVHTRIEWNPRDLTCFVSLRSGTVMGKRLQTLARVYEEPT